MRSTRLLAITLVASAAFLFSACDSQEEEGELEIVDLTVGEGALVAEGQCLNVHYTGWLEDGRKFDSSVDRGKPFQFRLGVSNVIEGWHQGVDGMRIGGKRKLTIPPHLGYGNQGWRVGLPNNATLIFEVELLSILAPPQDAPCNELDA